MLCLPATGEPDSFHNCIFLIKTGYLSSEFFTGPFQALLDAFRLKVCFTISFSYCSQRRLLIKSEKSWDLWRTYFLNLYPEKMCSLLPCFKD